MSFSLIAAIAMAVTTYIATYMAAVPILERKLCRPAERRERWAVVVFAPWSLLFVWLILPNFAVLDDKREDHGAGV
jgi:hypothetical protein